MFQYVDTDKAAKPLGHYSQAVIHNGTIYVATQLGIVPGKPIEVGSIPDQTKAALTNVREILKAAGSDLHKVLRVTVYVSDIRFWDEVNGVYSQFFGNHKPARGIISCKEFHKGFQVAFDVIAAV
ncbi:MAG TPA: RidA family protein [Chlamydiales bacterium]|nr:RidA family protein [Chlamydiales bacterium]